MQTDVEKHIQLFDKIAGPYNLFFAAQRKNFAGLLKQYGARLNLASDARVLDVGCGPGGVSAAFIRGGHPVEAVDGSPKMIEMARNNGISGVVADATDRLPYENDEFGLAVAAWVAHGLVAENRKKLYKEMQRVSSGPVLLHDYSPAGRGFSPFSIVGILERLERSDYIAFRRNSVSELKQVFASVEVMEINNRAAWYICA